MGLWRNMGHTYEASTDDFIRVCKLFNTDDFLEKIFDPKSNNAYTYDLIRLAWDAFDMEALLGIEGVDPARVLKNAKVICDVEQFNTLKNRRLFGNHYLDNPDRFRSCQDFGTLFSFMSHEHNFSIYRKLEENFVELIKSDSSIIKECRDFEDLLGAFPLFGDTSRTLTALYAGAVDDNPEMLLNSKNPGRAMGRMSLAARFKHARSIMGNYLILLQEQPEFLKEIVDIAKFAHCFAALHNEGENIDFKTSGQRIEDSLFIAYVDLVKADPKIIANCINVVELMEMLIRNKIDGAHVIALAYHDVIVENPERYRTQIERNIFDAAFVMQRMGLTHAASTVSKIRDGNYEFTEATVTVDAALSNLGLLLV